MKRVSKNVITLDKLNLVLESLQCLATDPEFESLVVPIIERTSAISLRTLEYFVISYSKRHHVSYWNGKQLIFYYPDYKSYLTSYPKKMFDPFRRKEDSETIRFYYSDRSVMTTVGQLNFFRWALQYKVLHYVKTHLKDIHREMKHRKQDIPWSIYSICSPESPAEEWSSSPELQ